MGSKVVKYQVLIIAIMCAVTGGAVIGTSHPSPGSWGRVIAGALLGIGTGLSLYWLVTRNGRR